MNILPFLMYLFDDIKLNKKMFNIKITIFLYLKFLEVNEKMIEKSLWNCDKDKILLCKNFVLIIVLRK